MQSRVEIDFIGRKVDEAEEKESDTSRFSATNGLSEFKQTFGPLIMHHGQLTEAYLGVV